MNEPVGYVEVTTAVRVRVKRKEITRLVNSRKNRKGPAHSVLGIYLLPIEEDERFFRRHEQDPDKDRVGMHFDVVRNFLLCLINTGKESVRIRDTKDLLPGQTHIIEKYPFRKFEWLSRYKIPVRIGRKQYLLHFEVPDYLPEENDYEPIPGQGRKAYRLNARLEILK